MTVKTAINPFKFFTGTDGLALENGKIYIGEANKNPEVFPVSVYWDSASVSAAAQPIRTINGYPSRNGSAGNIYVNSDYSMTVRDKNDNLVFTSFTAEDSDNTGRKTFSSVSAVAGGTAINTITLADNSGAIVEVYGAGLKSGSMACCKMVFSLYRTTGTTTINRVADDDLFDGDDTNIYFAMTQSSNAAILKAHTISGTWVASGEIKTFASGGLSFS